MFQFLDQAADTMPSQKRSKARRGQCLTTSLDLMTKRLTQGLSNRGAAVSTLLSCCTSKQLFPAFIWHFLASFGLCGNPFFMEVPQPMHTLSSTMLKVLVEWVLIQCRNDRCPKACVEHEVPKLVLVCLGIHPGFRRCFEIASWSPTEDCQGGTPWL